jgi:hypothetical protein
MWMGGVAVPAMFTSQFGTNRVGPGEQVRGQFVLSCSGTCNTEIDYVFRFIGSDDAGNKDLVFEGVAKFLP